MMTLTIAFNPDLVNTVVNKYGRNYVSKYGLLRLLSRDFYPGLSSAYII